MMGELVPLHPAREDKPASKAPRPKPSARVLNDTRDFLLRYMSFPEAEQVDAVTLWIVHTHAMSAADCTPRLSIQSAEKQSGKTRLLELLDMLVMSPLSVASISAAAMYRVIGEEAGTTLLIDEADTIFDGRGGRAEDLRGILNAGYRRSGKVARVAGGLVERLPVFAAVAMAGIGTLPDTVQDRSIVIRLKRRRASDPVSRLRSNEVATEVWNLRERLETWGDAYAPELRRQNPKLPTELGDRAADIWEPLFAIAAQAGGPWPARCKRAALVLSAGVTNEQSQGVKVLNDIRRVFAFLPKARRVSSADLVDGLLTLEDGTWDDALDARRLARLLEPYGLRPITFRVGEQVLRGYETKPFADVFDRYCEEEMK